MADTVLGTGNNAEIWYYTPGLKELKSYKT